MKKKFDDRFGDFVLGLIVGVVVLGVVLLLTLGFTPQSLLCTGLQDVYSVKTAIIDGECYVQQDRGESLRPASELIDLEENE